MLTKTCSFNSPSATHAKRDGVEGPLSLCSSRAYDKESAMPINGRKNDDDTLWTSAIGMGAELSLESRGGADTVGFE